MVTEEEELIIETTDRFIYELGRSKNKGAWKRKI